ncbi:MAG: hypothetical protein V1821_04375, partial [bacterium]
LLVPKERTFVAWEHHLPAGLEAVDEQLLTSQQFNQNDPYGGEYYGGKGGNYCPTTSDEIDCANPNDWWYDWWWGNAWSHTEMRDDRVFLFADHLGPGIYEYEFKAQAVTVGEFRLPPTRAYEFYDPNAVNSHNEGRIFKVTER